MSEKINKKEKFSPLRCPSSKPLPNNFQFFCFMINFLWTLYGCENDNFMNIHFTTHHQIVLLFHELFLMYVVWMSKRRIRE